MTLTFHRLVVPASVVALVMGLAPAATSAAPRKAARRVVQAEVASIAGFKDREVTVRYFPESDETTSALTLIPLGDDGQPGRLVLVFEERWAGKDTGQFPTALELRTYLLPAADQPAEERADLQFTVDGKAPIDLAGAYAGSFTASAEGIAMSVVRFPLLPAELDALSRTLALGGDAMGVPFALNAGQVQALSGVRRMVDIGTATLP